MPGSAHVVAVDWSGRRGTDERRAIWTAEADDGEVVALESGRSRTEVVELLIARARRPTPLVVGLDFACSLPAWYLRRLGVDTTPALWRLLAEERLTPAMARLGLRRWLDAPEPPFWTTREAHALLDPGQELRRTEQELRAPGVRPKSVFQLVGAGQVGRGSLFGMQALHRLRGEGFHVWPFDPAEPPVVVEIFPRLLTGRVRKGDRAAREAHLARLPLDGAFRRSAAASEDAFDAVCSCLAMAGSAEELLRLGHDPGHALEGRIWAPA